MAAIDLSVGQPGLYTRRARLWVDDGLAKGRRTQVAKGKPEK